MSDKNPRPGPKPDRLKIDGDWEDAVKKALDKRPPKPDQSDPEENDADSGEK